MKRLLIVAGLVTIFFTACQKQEKVSTAIVYTLEVSKITPSTAISGGTISTNAWLISWGLCWSTESMPTTDNLIVIDSTRRSTLRGNSFSMKITGLQGNTKYYVRALAINTNGIGYGNEFSFTTQPATVPVLNTSAATNITSVTITTGGKLLNTGGADVTDIGVCWSTSTNPLITNSKMSNAVDTGYFISPLTGLSPETIYYLRAYATNKLGTGYGNEFSFKTTSAETTVTDIDGNVYSTIRIGDQTWIQQNLKSTRYSNGDLIGTTSPANKDILTEDNPKYQWAYNGDERNVPLYGRLYTWYTVSDERNICPTGWHVASHAEWLSLMDYLSKNGYGYVGSGSELAKSIAANSGWITSDTQGSPGNDQSSNNNSGFSGLPGGGRGGRDSFSSAGYGAYWWSSTGGRDLAWDGCYMWHSYVKLYYGNRGKYQGLSVRCIKD
jgi:uncharacterized protein (TIGR02145 family)